MNRSLAVLACAGLASCAASRPLVPLAANQWAAEVSVPGLWTKSEFAMPVGSIVPAVRYGLTRDKELALRIHPLFLAKGILGTEIAGTWHARPARAWIPAVHLGLTLSTLVSPAHFGPGLGHGLRGALAIDTIAHWEPISWLWPYVVLQNAIVLADGRYVGSLFFGNQAQLGRAWSVSIETGLTGFNARDRDFTQPFFGVAGYGAIALSLSLSYRFPTPRAASPSPSELEAQP